MPVIDIHYFNSFKEVNVYVDATLYEVRTVEGDYTINCVFSRRSKWGELRRVRRMVKPGSKMGKMIVQAIKADLAEIEKRASKLLFEDLERRANEESTPDFQLFQITMGARENADTTVFEEKALPEGEHTACMWGSLRCLLCDEENEAVRQWFMDRGVSF
jgi:hypothetical protein